MTAQFGLDILNLWEHQEDSKGVVNIWKRGGGGVARSCHSASALTVTPTAPGQVLPKSPWLPKPLASRFSTTPTVTVSLILF